MPPSTHVSGSHAGGEPLEVTPETLRAWPLPRLDESGDKEDRGSVLVVGGALEMPGATILAATAALRAGAGKLRIATCRAIAQAVAVAIPEARVFGLPESRAGGIDPSAAADLAERANAVRATLVGPGMLDEDAIRHLIQDLLPRLEETTLVLDAGALECVTADPRPLRALAGRVILTPHAGEMAGMLGMDKAEVTRDPLAVARRAAADLGAVVALKGAETYIAAPDGAAYYYKSGNIGLATSGSGDTLAGVIVGLAARAASPAQAAVWGVYLHAGAGDRLARRVGPIGFLARELLAEIPPLLAELTA